MDQILSLPSQVSAPAPQEGGFAAAADEEPDSPGRSPRPPAPEPRAAADPVGDGLALMAGVAIALTSLLVPLACVIGDRTAPELAGTARPDR